MNDHSTCIGIFDSGVGGLSVLREVHRRYPGENILYLADQVHVPYGSRPMQEVTAFSEAIVRFLISRGAQLIVVACNTASAAALQTLRKRNPGIQFVGMEPAVKPAAEKTATGVVGVLATPATFQGELYASTVERYANGVKILQDTCPGLVDQIEQGKIEHKKTRLILEKALQPMLDQGVDEVVMGCTHYPFVIPLIEEIVGEDVQVIDPAPAVARQVGRLLRSQDRPSTAGGKGQIFFLTTGDADQFAQRITKLTGLKGSVEEVSWDGFDLRRA